MKSRDIIPGWPRGRSTSQPLLFNAEGTKLFDDGRYFLDEPPYFNHAKAAFDWVEKREERDGQEAERRRKADMMEAYWLAQRINIEKQKPVCCPECRNDGRGKKRLSVLEISGLWWITCELCKTVHLQDFQGINQLLRYLNEWPAMFGGRP